MEFHPYPKIPRLNREVIVTEKIDGTNASIFIQNASLTNEATAVGNRLCMVSDGGILYDMWAGSRNRWLQIESDNFGFARWVHDNASELLKLGPGHHFGEWWGNGIQRGYGLDHKRFSLFNTHRWGPVKLGAFEEVQSKGLDAPTPNFQNPFNKVLGLDVVPVLAQGDLREVVDYSIMLLREHGSHAAPGFKDPEGVVVFHTAANACFKVTLEKDDAPKSKTVGN